MITVKTRPAKPNAKVAIRVVVTFKEKPHGARVRDFLVKRLTEVVGLYSRAERAVVRVDLRYRKA